MNQTGQTLITAGSTLLAVVITFAGSYVLQRWQARKESESRRREAVAELLAAATDLINGLISLRAGYARRAGWRYWLRLLAVLWPDIRKLTRWQDLTDPDKLAPVIGSAVQIHREQLDDQRRAALDVSAVVQTRLNRYLSVAGVLALGDDKLLAEAVQALTPKVTALVACTAGPQHVADDVIREANRALGDFAAAADKRRR